MFLNLGKKNKSKAKGQEKSYCFKGQIWNSCLDTEKDLLIVETRDADAFQCWFYTIDLKKNKLLCEFQLEEECWWVGLKYAFDGNFVLYTYEDEKSPISKGVIIVDATRGIVRWKNEDYSFLDGQGNQICVRDTKEENNLTVSMESGRLVTFQELPDNKMVQTPMRYLPETDYFNETAELIKLVTDNVATESIEYLEHNNYLFISYYIYNELKQENHLLILTSKGLFVKEYCLSNHTKGIGFGDFVVYKNLLLFAVDNQNYTVLPIEIL